MSDTKDAATFIVELAQATLDMSNRAAWAAIGVALELRDVPRRDRRDLTIHI